MPGQPTGPLDHKPVLCLLGLCLGVSGLDTAVQTGTQGEMLDHHVITGPKNLGCRSCPDGKGDVCYYILSFAVRPEKLGCAKRGQTAEEGCVSCHYSNRTMTF